MPLHLSRRAFLLGIGAAALSVRCAGAEGGEVDADLIAILNDTHIAARPDVKADHAAHLKQAVKHLVSLPKRPAATFINGDLAYLRGEAGDYRAFAALIQPLRDAGHSIHLTMGNHDARDNFYKVLTSEKPQHAVVESRHVSVVQTDRANFFLLDSLRAVKGVPGEIGQKQLDWLAKALDEHRDKPAIVLGHHNPRFGGDPDFFNRGMIDSKPLWDVLVPRKHAKAYVHGHLHQRSFAAYQEIPILDTPATSYVQLASHTTGWTTARLTDAGMTLTTHTCDPAHAWNNEAHEVKWRALSQ